MSLQHSVTALFIILQCVVICLDGKMCKVNNWTQLHFILFFPPHPSLSLYLSSPHLLLSSCLNRWGAFTIAGMPSQLARGSRGPTRSLRQVRNGGGLHKTMPLSTSARNSSTLPRMNPRNTGPVSEWCGCVCVCVCVCVWVSG